MSESLTVLSWNVRGEIGISESRLQRQREFLEQHTDTVDLFLLQAVHYEKVHTGEWDGQLGALHEYFDTRGFHVVHTGDWARELRDSAVPPHADIQSAHNRCNLIASRWPIDRQSMTLRNRGDRKPRQLNYYYSQFPEKLLVAHVDLTDVPDYSAETVAVWSVGIINGANWGEEKLKMLETVCGRINLQTTKTGLPVIVGGDFNAPKRETATGDIVPHGQNTPKYTAYPLYGDPHYRRVEEEDELTESAFSQRWQRAETRLFDPNIAEWGMRDAYWAATTGGKAASTVDYTHVIETATPSKKRLDHIFVSDQFDVEHCAIWNGIGTNVNGLNPSDHAPVVTDLATQA